MIERPKISMGKTQKSKNRKKEGLSGKTLKTYFFLLVGRRFPESLGTIKEKKGPPLPPTPSEDKHINRYREIER